MLRGSGPYTRETIGRSLRPKLNSLFAYTVEAAEQRQKLSRVAIYQNDNVTYCIFSVG